MVYGRILYNNIKEYTPKWYPTIPYSQTVKPIFHRQPQVVSNMNANPLSKRVWRTFGKTVQYNSWLWQVFIFGFAICSYFAVYYPIRSFYIKNNAHRTYQVAMQKERAHQKKLQQAQAAQEAEDND